MADKIKKDSAETTEPTKKSKKTDKDTSKEKKANIFVRMGKSISKFFKDFKGECKKIVWPDGKTVLKSSLVVIASVAVLGLAIWIVDSCLSEIIKLLVNVAKNSAADNTTTSAVATTVNAAGAIVSRLFGV
ncbi:MAG: preprotein translocase subunit SecE, partial [Oscillospiraceae bacterium]